MHSRAAGAFLLLVLQCSPAATAGSLPVVGWMTQEFFIEAAHSASDSPFHREFYPSMQDSSHWTERVVIDQIGVTPGATPQSLLDLQVEKMRESCVDFVDNRYDLPAEMAATTALLFWHCPRDDESGRGVVGSMKVLVGSRAAYMITASGNYEPFEQGTTPVLKAQVARWVEFLRSFGICDALTHPGCAPAAQVFLDAPAASLSADEQAQVRLAESRGIALYIRDQFAWHATDYVVANNLIKNRRKHTVFLATANPDGTGQVYFVQKRKTLRIDMDENFRPTGSEWERSTPDSIAAPLRALKLATAKADGVCGETVNNVVLEREDGKGWLVYLLGATTRENVIIFGRHKRIGIDAAATRIISDDASTLGCLAMEVNPSSMQGPDSKWMGTLVSHLVSQVPWETHVFQSLTFNVPVFVTTDHAAWHVQSGRIVKIDLDGRSDAPVKAREPPVQDNPPSGVTPPGNAGP